MRIMRAVLLLGAALVIERAGAFVPVPAEGAKGGEGKRGLFVDLQDATNQRKTDGTDAFVPVPSSPPTTGAKFVAVDDASNEPRPAGKRGLMWEDMGNFMADNKAMLTGQQVLDFFEEQVQGGVNVGVQPVLPPLTLTPHQTAVPPVPEAAAVRPLYAFPGLKARRLQSDELDAMGHDNIVSRMLALAEMSHLQAQEMGLERLQREHENHDHGHGEHAGHQHPAHQRGSGQPEGPSAPDNGGHVQPHHPPRGGPEVEAHAQAGIGTPTPKPATGSRLRGT
jgi:hypothetical protein